MPMAARLCASLMKLASSIESEVCTRKEVGQTDLQQVRQISVGERFPPSMTCRAAMSVGLVIEVAAAAEEEEEEEEEEEVRVGDLPALGAEDEARSELSMISWRPQSGHFFFSRLRLVLEEKSFILEERSPLKCSSVSSWEREASGFVEPQVSAGRRR